jgi:hypothetical protein
VTLPSGYVWTNKLSLNGSIEVLAVMQPPLTYSVSAGNLNFEWPPSHLGWILESQTNSINVGITSTWYPVSGSEATISMQIPIDAINAAVFFRLRSP